MPLACNWSYKCFCKCSFISSRWSGSVKKYKSQKLDVSMASRLPWKTYILKCTVFLLTPTLKILKRGLYCLMMKSLKLFHCWGLSDMYQSLSDFRANFRIYIKYHCCLRTTLLQNIFIPWSVWARTCLDEEWHWNHLMWKYRNETM